MQAKLHSSPLIAAAFLSSTTAFAAGTGSDFYPADFSSKIMHYEKTMDVPMSGGNSMKIYVVRMRGHRMAVVPVEQLESILGRAEGRSISLQ
jgi:hypothetical protein